MLKIGIVGAGLRGRLFAAALHNRPDLSVVGFAEPSERVAKEAALLTGLPVVPSHTDLLSDLSPEAVIVATPDFAHRDVAVAVARAGVDLLIEKPLASTLLEATDIAAAVTTNGVRCLVGFENRWNPHAVRAHEIVSSGSLGVPITSSATLSNSYFVPEKMLSWSSKSSPAWFLMPHSIDLLLWLTGRSPVTVTAVGSKGVLQARGIDTWDVIHALITFDDATTANLTSAWVLPDGGESIVDFRFSLIGTEGSIAADLTHQGLSIVTNRLQSLSPQSGRVGRTELGAAAWMVNDFVSGLIDGTDLGPDVGHGVLVSRLICAIEWSLELTRAVSLAEL